MANRFERDVFESAFALRVVACGGERPFHDGVVIAYLEKRGAGSILGRVLVMYHPGARIYEGDVIVFAVGDSGYDAFFLIFLVDVERVGNGLDVIAARVSQHAEIGFNQT